MGSDADSDVGPAPRPRRATLRDVAALAGVSFKTVSRVVNDEGGVSAELSQRVLAASAQLNYRPNHSASALRRQGRSMTVGLVVEDVANPFFAAIHRGVESVASRRGYTLISGSVLESDTRERELVSAFAARQVDGLLIVPSNDVAEHLAQERRQGTSVVYIDRTPGRLDADAVIVDNRIGARAGVQHLLAHGHRRIGFLGDLVTIQTAEERYLGYIEAHAALGVPVDPRLVRRDVHSELAAEAAAMDLFGGDSEPTALFAGQNLITYGTVRALRRLGRERTVALVGFDDFALADLLVPAVTVVAQDPDALGQEAAERLLARIEGDDSLPQVIVVPTRLVPRGSGEITSDGS